MVSGEQYRRLFENMREGYACCQVFFEDGKACDFLYLTVNRAFETLTGLKEVAGKRVSEVIPGIRESDPSLFEIFGRVALTGTPEKFEIFVAALQQWFSVSAYRPVPGHFVAVFDVITGKKGMEVEIRRRGRSRDPASGCANSRDACNPCSRRRGRASRARSTTCSGRR